MYLSHRHAPDRMSLLSKRLPNPFQNLSLPAIFLRVTEKHAAFG